MNIKPVVLCIYLKAFCRLRNIITLNLSMITVTIYTVKTGIPYTQWYRGKSPTCWTALVDLTGLEHGN